MLYSMGEIAEDRDSEPVAKKSRTGTLLIQLQVNIITYSSLISKREFRMNLVIIAEGLSKCPK